MGRRIVLQIDKALADTLAGVADAYAADLREFLWRNHRVTGDLARSVAVDAAPDGRSADVGSGLPYGGLFEAKTGAVLAFTEDWAARGGKPAQQAGERAAAAISNAPVSDSPRARAATTSRSRQIYGGPSVTPGRTPCRGSKTWNATSWVLRTATACKGASGFLSPSSLRLPPSRLPRPSGLKSFGWQQSSSR